MSGQSYISGGGVEGCCCFATISTSEVGVIERFGKFDRFVEVWCITLCRNLWEKVSPVSSPYTLILGGLLFSMLPN